MRILLIEDDRPTAMSLELVLSSQGYVCDVTGLGETGLEFGKVYNYDVIILDLMLPDMDGYEVLNGLRGANVQAPIVILSGLGTPEFKAKGLYAGADDYLAKPFDEGELLARLRAVVRRSKGHVDKVIRTGELSVNLDNATAEVRGRPIHVTGKEYLVLELLALRKGKLVSKDTLLDHLYHWIDEPDLKIIDVFVCKLRKKLLLASGSETYIQTYWGHGYILRNEPVAETIIEMPGGEAPVRVAA